MTARKLLNAVVAVALVTIGCSHHKTVQYNPLHSEPYSVCQDCISTGFVGLDAELRQFNNQVRRVMRELQMDARRYNQYIQHGGNGTDIWGGVNNYLTDASAGVSCGSSVRKHGGSAGAAKGAGDGGVNRLFEKLYGQHGQ